MATITTAQATEIYKIVSGLFNAAPGAAYLSEFANFVAAGGSTLQLAKNLAATTAFTGSIMSGKVTAAAQVQQLMTNFGLTYAATPTAGTAAGDAQIWFAAQITANRDFGTIVYDAVTALNTPAWVTANPLYASVATTLTNKAAVAEYYSATLATSSTSLAALQSVVSAVTATTVVATTADLAAALAAGGGSAGTTFTLTTGGDSFTGGSGNDTFNALVDGGGTTDTITAIDVIAGGTGTDTLNVTTIGTAVADVLQGALVSGIEVVAIRNTVATGTVFGVNATGLTGVTASGIGDVSATNMATGVALSTSSTGAAILSQTYVAAATAAVTNIAGGSALGTVTYVGAGLTGVTINTTGTTASTAGAVDVAGAAAITIAAASNLTVTSIATTSTAGVITVTGAGAVAVGVLDTGVTTVTATDNSGGVSATLSAAAQVFTGGSGNDTLTTGTIVLTGTANAGAGTGDKLIVSAAADIAATPGAKYTNFEVLENLAGGATLNVSPVVGVTSIRLAATGQGAAGMNATQAAAVTNLVDNATLTLGLTTATGSADALTVTLANATATTSADLTAATVTGFETMNVVSSSGSATDINSLAFAAAGNLTTLNLTGAKPITVSTANITSIATISAANLTYAGSTATQYALTISGALASGSTVTGSAAADSMTVSTSTLGTTYNGGAGNDMFSANVADLVADGVGGDHALNGGDGTDTLTILDTTGTVLDNHFTNVSNLEKIVTSTGDTSITLAAGFNAAFANGVTITTGTITATKDVQLAAALANKNITITVDATSNTGAASETYSLVTGTGADTVTFTGDADWVGVGGAAQGTIVISTGAGADTISVTTGTLVSNGTTTGQAITITGGTGADAITKVGTNTAFVLGTTQFVMASGDSNATTTGYDSITGFDFANTTLSDVLDFDGAGAVGAFATETDSGTILTHSIAGGLATFDDAAVYAAAVVVNATNLADVLGYLAANVTTTSGAIAFAYDRDASGTAESTMVWSNQATDSLVLLVGVLGVSLNATLTTTTAGAIGIA